jgi:lipopolysaccharide biosynthesis glycosyltransferase
VEAFCTIITPDYFPFVKSLYKSIIQHGNVKKLCVLVCTSKNDVYAKLPATTEDSGIQLFYLDDFSNNKSAGSIYQKYYHNDIDAYRWSMKPVFLNVLLQAGQYDKVIYVDTDIFFFNDYSFLFNMLDNNEMLLTPHWRNMHPSEEVNRNDLEDFNLLFTSGIFNAGFVGANSKGLSMLNWWANACIYKCEKRPEKGFFVDQTYLNLFPLLCENLGIIQHRGCNVADWNRTECKRTVANEQVLINKKFPIIFIHFTNSLIESIQIGKDLLLEKHFAEYKENYQLENGVEMPLKQGLYFKKEASYIDKIKNRLRIRTRIKRFLQG